MKTMNIIQEAQAKLAQAIFDMMSFPEETQKSIIKEFAGGVTMAINNPNDVDLFIEQ